MAKPRLTYRQNQDLPLETWLSLVLGKIPRGRHELIDYMFPSDKQREEYFGQLATIPDSEVKGLLRGFLMIGGGLGSDSNILRFWLEEKDLDLLIQDREFARRLISTRRHTWEGNTWILDLLPSNPQAAVDVLRAYIEAHIQYIPDGRLHGLSDAIAVISARYLEQKNEREKLFGVHSRDFEFLVAALYLQEDGVCSSSDSRDSRRRLRCPRRTR